MGLFDKKFCDICGEKISLLGNRKLEDGNMCSQCAKLISPFMTDRRRTSGAEMKEHLQYREDNRKNLADFNVYEAYEGCKNVYIDKAKGVFVVTSYDMNSFRKENPDVIPLNEVVSCNLDVREDREEEYYQDQQGNRQRFNPPRYRYEYDFYINIRLSNRWFDEIEFKLNKCDVEGMGSPMYGSFQLAGQQIVGALTGKPVNFAQGTGYGSGGAFNPASGVGAAAGLFNAFANQVAANAQQQQYQQQQYQQPQYQQPQYQQPQYQQNQYQQSLYQQPQVQQPQQNARWFCPNCGAENNGKFCTGCGTPKP